MGDRLRLHADVQPRQGIRRILARRQRRHDIEKLFLGQTHQRTAQQRPERQGVSAIGEDPGHGDEVLDFLTPKQALSGLGGDGNAMSLQGLLVAPELAPGGRQQGDVAGPTGAAFTTAVGVGVGVGVANHLASNETRAYLRNGFRLAVALFLGGGLALLVGHRNVQRCHRRALDPIGLERIQRREPGLIVPDGERGPRSVH